MWSSTEMMIFRLVKAEIFIIKVAKSDIKLV